MKTGGFYFFVFIMRDSVRHSQIWKHLFPFVFALTFHYISCFAQNTGCVSVIQNEQALLRYTQLYLYLYTT